MNKKIIEIKVEKIDSRNFIDEEIETLEKYTDKKTGRVLGYYKPEIYYAPHNAERITEEQFLKNLGIKKTKNNFEKIKQMSVDDLAEYLCLMVRLGIKEALNNVGITDEEMKFPPIEKSIEACKQILLQEVEE